MNKFVRWYGRERPLSQLAAREVASYAERMEGSSANTMKRLAPVRAFLSYAKKEGLIKNNLAVHLRVKKGSLKQEPPGRGRIEAVILTPEGYQELKAELSALQGERPRIADDIRKAAADKDFHENAPLDAAKDHQGMVEARIRQLETILKSAVVTTKKGDSAKVMLGSIVTLQDLSSNEELRYTLVNPSEASPSKGKLSIASPTGKALLSRRQGETIAVAAPAGTLRYRIARIED
ncbi:MAG: GreA/GreB family elongation factor [Dehalococcoidia bacterium]|nr:GreA/GreB family elongation factor [Dehalococcoidia bacterium]